MPRPMRLRLRLAPSLPLSSWSFVPIVVSLFGRLDPHHVRDGADHAADGRRVVQHDRLVHPGQAQPLDGVLVTLRAVGPAAHQGDFQLARHRLCSHTWRSSAVLPRSFAVSSIERSILSASMVAWITLCGFDVPMHLVRMSCTPATSSSGRTAPPAMMPVPGAAGRSSTRPAPKTPMTSCGTVPLTSGILKMFFLAWSVPLRIASGT